MKVPPTIFVAGSGQDVAHDGAAAEGGSGGLIRPSRIWYMVILATVFWALVLSLHSGMQGDLTSVLFKPSAISLPLLSSFTFDKNPAPEQAPVMAAAAAAAGRCAGRYIYMYDMPPRFNVDLLRDCRALRPWTDVGMCQYIVNGGMGELLGDEGGVFSERGWFATDQFVLDIIFHGRMKGYGCLTNDSASAAAVFVPFYGGCDIGRYLFSQNASIKDALSDDFVGWLVQQPEWRVMGGRDHFLVPGRTTWDFLRRREAGWEWGNKLLWYPAVQNMTAILVESSPWSPNNFAIPYPTYFHPETAADVVAWQEKVRSSEREWLFSFAGGPRKGNGTIRADIIRQCRASSFCNHLHCGGAAAAKCNSPGAVMSVFQNSHFCLQPRGDTMTRRSTFDTILAGCVPVFFHPGSAYDQYTLHFPPEPDSYSVLIMHSDVTGRNVSIEETLRRIPPERVKTMREEVIRLIPTVVYADTRSRRVDFRDAFDVAVDAVIDRVARRRRGEPDGRQK
ncbi:hypothetical protein ABZP36_012223 [Zizania latifolia]